MKLQFTVKAEIHNREHITVDDSEILYMISHEIMVPDNGSMTPVPGLHLVLNDGSSYEAFDQFDDIAKQLDELKFIQAQTIHGKNIAFDRNGVDKYIEDNEPMPGIKLNHVYVKFSNGKHYRISAKYPEFHHYMTRLDTADQ